MRYFITIAFISAVLNVSFGDNGNITSLKDINAKDRLKDLPLQKYLVSIAGDGIRRHVNEVELVFKCPPNGSGANGDALKEYFTFTPAVMTKQGQLSFFIQRPINAFLLF